MSRGARRLPESFAPNVWAERIATLRAAGRTLIDLTLSNPTRVGLVSVTPQQLAALGDPRGAEDRPDPRGLQDARVAVAGYYAERGTPLDPDALVLTTGTSESYAHLLRLLAEPGDVVLVPTPSYPLIEPIARLEGVDVASYRLAWDGAWHLDLDSFDRALERVGDRARAAIVIEPNHPTGTCLSAAEREALEARLAARGLALIADEVFGDFAWPPRAPFPTWLGARRVPTFVLSGLSKVCGMPQLKLGWIAVAGVERAAGLMEGLEWIADLFLSVGQPVQRAAPALLGARSRFQARVLDRIATNRDALATLVREHPEVSRLEGEGGWAAILRLPSARVEDWSLALLAREVVVHPGHFYDLELPGTVVLSLISEVEIFRDGLQRIGEALSPS